MAVTTFYRFEYECNSNGIWGKFLYNKGGMDLLGGCGGCTPPQPWLGGCRGGIFLNKEEKITNNRQ